MREVEQREARRSGRGARVRGGFLAGLGAMLALPAVASASQLLVPAIGTPDAAMQGATVAAPMTVTAAAFSNPAGLAVLEPGFRSFAFGLPVGRSRLDADSPPGYDTTSDFIAYAPEGGAVGELENGLRWGFALYGSLGSSFDSDADPRVGVDHDFYSSSAVTNAALLASWPVTDRLSIGASLALLYGQTHLRYFQQKQFAYTVRGPGLQASVGLRYQLAERVALGLSFRTPGMVWADGDDRLPDGSKQDVDLDWDMPAQIFLGLNADVTDRLHVGVLARWTDASTLSDSVFRFGATPAADLPFIASASDEWRFSAGAGYDLCESLRATFGVGWADAIVPDTWVSPLLIDSDEWKFTLGLSWRLPGSLDRWILDVTGGYSPNGVRNIPASQAVISPGRYNIGGEIYMIGLRTAL